MKKDSARFVEWTTSTSLGIGRSATGVIAFRAHSAQITEGGAKVTLLSRTFLVPVF